ncbi:single-stranded-DNA-specific exonuclease RecJ [Candidatus Curculioniphilus buchneri]|uniref:single-stranded-DNA-specific exonuclease RecJ n=1 Tax=Candidatus Curculioniphilus buchneri TaxID=690594 RepID=UPI00376ECC59
MINKTTLRRRPIGNVSLLEEADIPLLLKQLYVQRGINTISELELKTRNLLAYYQINGIKTAVTLLVKAILNQHNFMIIGDFDVDGVTSTALTVLSLRQMGAKNVNFLIPNRFKDGYGLSPAIVEKAAAHHAQLILTVDNGISSYAGVKLAREKAIPIIITDHHLPGTILPDADAIVNPNVHDCTFPSKCLAGVGVAFYLLLALRAQLNSIGWFVKKGIMLPKLAEFLDLVAFGTVADLVPLDSNNRILVHQGIKRIQAGRCRPGIQALSDIAKIDRTQLCTNDISFSLGPRLNAAGRIDDMSIGVDLLLTDDLLQAHIFSKKLDVFNKSRREIEQRMKVEAMTLCQNLESCNQSQMPYGLAMYHDKWHEGVIGILAARIKEYFHRPVIAFASTQNGLLKGSGRSISGLHLCNLLEHLNVLYPKLMLNFGGHAMAVGLTLEQKKFNLFQKHFSELVNDHSNSTQFEEVIWSDGELTDKDLTLNTAELLRNAGPWGQSFPNPLFDGYFQIVNHKIIKKQHLKLILKPLIGGPILDGIAFNIDPSCLPINEFHIVQLAYQLNVITFRGQRSLQLLIQHIWPL